MTTRRFIGRCRGCKGVVRLALEMVVVRPAQHYWTTGVMPRPVSIPERFATVTLATGQRVVDAQLNSGFWAPCLCGAQVEVLRIRGRASEQPCGAKCRNATGPDCECACRGENHGAGYAA